MTENPLPPIVAIGASAGGLDALERFFSTIPADTGRAFVVVQHLSPDFKSIMDDLLARRTRMTIRQAATGIHPEANVIYLNPPKTQLSLVAGAFRLSEAPADRSVPLPIDDFFASLADHGGKELTAVVLSGTGTDGSRGIVKVHEAGGRILAQSAASAKFDGMPRAALATGVVDFAGTPEELAQMVAFDEVRSPSADQGPEPAEPLDEREQALLPLFDLMRQFSGIDFAQYKPSTVERRLDRRLAARSCESLEGYLAILRADPNERDELLASLLIEVTHCFRDPPAFELLGREHARGMLEGARDEVRIWVPGCASGEEAYSWAILLMEAAEGMDRAPSIRIFATDIHRRSLERAAAGIYGEQALANLEPSLIAKYFVSRDGTHHQVLPQLRSNVVFAEHNLLKDPPFTRMHAVSCRNVLIYLKAPAQEQVLSRFHFALAPGGILFLGPSETLGSLQTEFETLDRTWRIYRKPASAQPLPQATFPAPGGLRSMRVGQRNGYRARTFAPRRSYYERLLERFVPDSFVVTAEGVLLHVFGQAGRFLTLRGPSAPDLYGMLDERLRVAIATAVQRAHRSKSTVAFGAVPFESEGRSQLLRLIVEPLSDSGEPDAEATYLARLEEEREFVPAAQAAPVEPFAPDRAVGQHLQHLEQQLLEARENLQATVEELETSNEELQAANEELLASNEELQSTNEELQSVNEELYTVNAEYEQRNRDLLELNRDLSNLIDSTDIGTIFLDGKLCIRKFTPSIQASFRLRASDLGRPLEELASRLRSDESVLEDARRVLKTGELVEREVRGGDGQPLLQRLTPYRTEQGTIAGVVITFVDVTEMHAVEDQLRTIETLQRAILDSIFANVAVIDRSGNIILVNSAWEAFAEHNAAPSVHGVGVGANYFAACVAAAGGREGSDAQRALAGTRDVILGRAPLFEMTYPCHGPEEKRWFLMRVTPLDRPEGGAVVMHLDITAMHLAQQQYAQLSNAISQAATALFVADAEGTIQHANDAFLKLTGYVASEIVGQPASLLRAEEQPRERFEQLWQTVSAGETWTGQLVNRRKDGSTFIAETTIVPVLDEAGRVSSYLTIARDVTVLARQNEQLRQTQKLETIGQLAGGVAHDFNNLLTPILGYAEMLLEDGPEAIDRETAEQVLACAERAQTLTRQLLAFSRKQPLKLETVDLNEVVRGFEKILRRLIREDVVIDCRLGAMPLPVLADPRQLEQVLLNLVVNARDAMPDGGTITISTAELPVSSRDQAMSPELRPGRYAVLGVRDEGTGITEEVRPHLFEPFFTTKPPGQGTGLGLATVYGIAKQHEGSVLVKSRAGEGALFSLCLPLRDRSVLREEPVAPLTPVPQGEGERILVVEDDERVGNLAVRLLERGGYAVTLFRSPREAVEHAGADAAGPPPALVLTDVVMPGLNGPELVSELRKRYGRGLRALFMSGYPAEVLSGERVVAPGTDVLTKPFTGRALLEGVRRALDRARLADVIDG